LSLFLKHFSDDDELMVTVEAADSEAAEAATTAIAESLRSHPEIARKVVDRPPWEEDPAQLSEFAAYLLLNSPPNRIRPALQRVAPGEAEKTAWESVQRLSETSSPTEIFRLSYDPFRFSGVLGRLATTAADRPGEFSSGDGTFHVIYVEAAPVLSDYRKSIAWIASIKEVIASIPLPSGVKIRYTGEPAFKAEISAGMQRDMTTSGFSTLVFIGLIFWLCHRRIVPLAHLVTMLALIFVLSLSIAGLFLSELTVIGVGFAAIMIGLSVDYGYVIYQDWSRVGGTAADLRKRSRSGILWASGTTAVAFFMLNFSSLPGLSQLGNLVAIGVLVGAGVMLTLFAALIARLPWTPHAPSRLDAAFGSPRTVRCGAWGVAGLVAILLAALVFRGWPALDAGTNAFRPRHSDANDALDRVYEKLSDQRDFLSLIVSGRNEQEVLSRLHQADEKLVTAQGQGKILSYISPLPLWPDEHHQKENLPLLASLAGEKKRLQAALEQAGFTEDAFALTARVLDQWAGWQSQQPPIWPQSPASLWIMRHIASHAPGEFVTLGIVRPAPGQVDALMSIQGEGICLVSWEQMGAELKRTIPREFLWLVGSLVAVVLFLLYFAFRSLIDVALCAVTMALVFLSLMGAMALLGWDWNLFNLATLLLLLGTGVDYSIYMILALRRHPEETLIAQKTTGQVIFQCAASAVVGFGSISWVSNMGLASMGRTCALGLMLDALIAIYLLPAAWRFFHRQRK
jgi:predicted exporter